MNRKRKEAALATVIGVALLTSPLLLMAGGFEIASWFFGDKAQLLNREGVVTQATVVEVTKDRLGEALHANSEYQRDVSPGMRSKIMHWTFHYHFETGSGEEVKGGYSGQTYEEPVVGGELEVRYLPSDPSVHELKVGHTESQTSALHWIAIAFAFIWIATVFVATIQAVIPRKQTTREKRIARQQALENGS